MNQSNSYTLHTNLYDQGPQLLGINQKYKRRLRLPQGAPAPLPPDMSASHSMGLTQNIVSNQIRYFDCSWNRQVICSKVVVPSKKRKKN